MLDIGCLRCKGELSRYSVLRGFAARCDGCDGLLVDGTALSSVSGDELVASVMSRAERATSAALPCSVCEHP